MKKPPYILIFSSLFLLIMLSGCIRDQPPRYVRGSYRSVPRSPYIGSPEWITWVDHKVDTRYANGIRPDPGSQEWYAIVDHVVFSDHTNDYYQSVYRNQYRDAYRDQYRDLYRADGRRNYSSNYNAPARYGDRDRDRDRIYPGRYKLGSVEWKRAVDSEILSGRVPPPPPRSDPWDAPLAPTH